MQTPIVELFGDAVKLAERALMPHLKTVSPAIQQVHYLYGHPREIVGQLVEMNKLQQYQLMKYPLVALFMDFPEPASTSGLRSTPRLRGVIANRADETGKAKDRYQTNFKPILYPLYEAILSGLAQCGHFLVTSPRAIEHTKTDRPYWGREGLYGNEGNIFGDALDCIEFSDLRLPVQYANLGCRTPTSNLF